MNNPIIEYWYNGAKRSKRYISNGKLCRNPLEGPARFWYDTYGILVLESYHVDDKLHNPYGPAWLDYQHNEFGWFLNGHKYKDEVNEYLDKHGLMWQNMSRTDFDIMWAIIL